MIQWDLSGLQKDLAEFYLRTYPYRIIRRADWSDNYVEQLYILAKEMDDFWYSVDILMGTEAYREISDEFKAVYGPTQNLAELRKPVYLEHWDELPGDYIILLNRSPYDRGLYRKKGFRIQIIK